MCSQRITNIGPDDLIFLAICTPRFSNDVYEDLEKPVDKNSLNCNSPLNRSLLAGENQKP